LHNDIFSNKTPSWQTVSTLSALGIEVSVRLIRQRSERGVQLTDLDHGERTAKLVRFLGIRIYKGTFLAPRSLKALLGSLEVRNGEIQADSFATVKY
jgi:hypothetical protein